MKKILIGIGIIFLSFITLIVLMFQPEKDMVTDTRFYEDYIGKDGKYKDNYLPYNDIFPDSIPENAQVEDFRYFYYNPWDGNYMGYLVYTCDDETYAIEHDRLLNIESTERKYIYGATEFPYELCAVYASDYGYIYALADENNKRFIYVELQFCNSFTDIDYEKYIDTKYLPTGFNAKMGEIDKID